MNEQEAKGKIVKLYNAFNDFYYGGECVPRYYSNLSLCIDFLEETAPDEIEGHTELRYSTKEDSAQIVIKIKKSLTQEKNDLHLSAVLLHEMVHAYMFVNHIYDLDKDKLNAVHNEKFRETARQHGLQDGLIIPNEEIIYVMGEKEVWK